MDSFTRLLGENHKGSQLKMSTSIVMRVDGLFEVWKPHIQSAWLNNLPGMLSTQKLTKRSVEFIQNWGLICIINVGWEHSQVG